MKRSILIAFLTVSAVAVFAQAPPAINYQSVIRDASGNPLANQFISLRLSVLQTSVSGKTVYAELAGKTTSAEGLVQVELGISDPLAFKDIDWSKGPYYLKVELDPLGGSAYQLAGTSQILSVPFALYAANADYHASMTVRTDPSHHPDSALFVVNDRNGEPVFSVFEDGVEVIVNEPAVKGARGGFVVTGRSPSKGIIKPILQLDPDQFRVFLDVPLKGGKGGFAVGSRSAVKAGVESNYMQLTPENYFIGQESGASIENGQFNSFLGYRAGFASTSASNNVFLGYQAGSTNFSGSDNNFLGTNCGFSNYDGSNNVFVGVNTGYSNTSGFSNNFIGNNAGYFNSDGTNNTFIGTSAGYSNLGTSGNIFIGVESGYAHTIGWQNVYIGNQSARNLAEGANNVVFGTLAGSEKTAGDINVLIGAYAGQNNGTGSNNVYLGPHAGRNATGSNNVFIGSSAGYSETGSGKLYIANNDPAPPLIYGDFPSGRLVVNGFGDDNTGSRNFFVNGTAGGKFGWYTDSDRKLKKDIVTIPDALQKVLLLRGVNFSWIHPDAGVEGKQLGFVAQEVLPVLPEVVNVKDEHYSMEYASITALLVEAIKQQQEQIASQAEQIKELKKENWRLTKLEEQMNSLLLKLGEK